MAFPVRVSPVPMNVAWFELNTGRPLPMFARYLAYVDTAMIAIVAAATLTAPALVQTRRVPLQLMQVPLVSMQTGNASDVFARYIEYIDTCLRRLITYANAHAVTTPVFYTQVPTNVVIVNVESGLPTDNFADYFNNLDSVIQRLIAAGV